MNYTELIKNIDTYTYITDDSRKIRPDCIFVCIKGEKFDGHTVAGQCLEKGAAFVVCDHDLGLGEKQVIAEDTRKALGELIAAFNGHPEKKLHLIGITGTNGKTTTATLVHHILMSTDHKCGFIGTTAVLCGNDPMERDDSTPTTPAVGELYEIFSKMVDAGCEYCVMEVSSFALAQNRIGPAKFITSVFTNLTQDHLDYHGDMENYYQAKKLLFTEHSEYALINADDEYGIRLVNELGNTDLNFDTYGRQGEYGYKFHGFENGISKFEYYGEGVYPFELRMIGEYNISNATAAIAVCEHLDINMDDIQSAVRSFKGVRGRCELIPTNRDFHIICDYAHSPDGLENVLPAVKSVMKEGRLVCLFGCGGDRDRTKRPKMAAAVGKYADFIIVTSDNPRNEDPERIIDDIVPGLPENADYIRITDRRQAIYYAVKTAKKGDMIVLAGKGHEDYQILAGGVHIHFDEPEIVTQALADIFEKFSLNELSDITGGKLVKCSEENAGLSYSAEKICSDTRKLDPGDIFIAIKGENFDGADHIPTAIEKGAAAVIAERENGEIPTIIVGDSRKALRDIAAAYRRRFDIPVIGVTGSVGKTTAKDMIAAAVSSKFDTLATAGNLNNEIGMPFTLLKLKNSTGAAVIEMGMNHFGEMDRLARTSQPNICVITNIGWSHIENLGSREGILSAKLEILNGASPDAPLIVGDDDMLLTLKNDERVKGHELTVCGLSENADVRAVNIRRGERTVFDVQQNGEVIGTIDLAVQGDHHIMDALIAVTAAMKAGCDFESAAEKLSEFVPGGLRQHIEHYGDADFLVDCYNAAPASMKAALSVLDGMAHPNCAVLGDMLELGSYSEKLHRLVGEYASEYSDNLVVVGENAKFIADEFGKTGKPVFICPDNTAAAEEVKKLLSSGVKAVLFKASRGMKFEEIIEKVRN